MKGGKQLANKGSVREGTWDAGTTFLRKQIIPIPST